MDEIKMIIFDVDGLLLNTEFLWEKAWSDVATKYQIPEFGKVFHKVVGISGKDVEKILDDNLGDVIDRDELLKEARTLGMSYLEKDIELRPGVIELLDKLEQLDIRKAVATTTKRDLTEQRLSKMGIINRFEYILCGDEVKKRKPDPEIYNTVLQRVDCDRRNVLVLEDTGYGVQAAHDAGLKVIMVPSINPPTDIDKSNAYRIVDSLFDVITLIETNQTF